MDKLKALVSAKRKAVDSEFGGKKYVKRSEIEGLRLKKLREEEELERRAKEAKRLRHDERAVSAEVSGQDALSTGLAPPQPEDGGPAAGVPEPGLSREQVVRRLRKLKQPVTLFGESDALRFQRLQLAERNVHMEDEAAGGQQANLHIQIAREQRDLGKASRSKAGKEGGEKAAPSAQPLSNEVAALDDEQEQLLHAFQAAADVVAEQNLPVEERIGKWLRRWMLDWEQDLESRPEEVKASPAGHQADVRFKETQQYLRPLFGRLKQRSLDPQMLAGIKLIVESMIERNYLHAYKIYMGVAIGNSPWPIGVTQVGLHERASREKISFKYASGSAHIMNDEATRKFIQALKRLMTFCQRRYPTDPSRSVDFDGRSDLGHGAVGAGSDKVALLQAVARGDAVALAPAPSLVDARGDVQIPSRWDHMIRDALQEVAASDAAERKEEQAQQHASKALRATGMPADG